MSTTIHAKNELKEFEGGVYIELARDMLTALEECNSETDWMNRRGERSMQNVRTYVMGEKTWLQKAETSITTTNKSLSQLTAQTVEHERLSFALRILELTINDGKGI